ncbi:ATP-dependent endonuclease [Photobacterium swingsii]|uniref:ATP-dependent nuclease n=1 Tax=Photobacterium swingsii TaxID=680026 RepID=UPI003D0EE9EF
MLKLERLLVKNFRSIGAEPVEIELDDIVILVGGNNAGKSTILKAYQSAVESAPLEITDYHNCKINEDNLPTVEIHTIVSGDDCPKLEYWCAEVQNNENTDEKTYRVKEQWIWDKSKKAKRLGYRVDLDKWATDSDKPKMPWAADNAARNKRPKAHRVSTFDDPTTQSEAIKGIVVDVLLEEKIRQFEPKDDANTYDNIIDKFKVLKNEFVESSEQSIKEISTDISDLVQKVIPKHKLNCTLNKSDLKDNSFKMFDQSDFTLNFGVEGKYLPIENHGSGARRTLLWAVLKSIADLGFEAIPKGKKFNKTPEVNGHLLLLDEPEISLHPSAAREARDVLYSLAEENDNWQVMVTTHSPSFIDLTREHTKIIRVESDGDKIQSTTLFRPNDVAFSQEEKENIKLLNMMSPNALEFFFGGKVLVVEGDTEYTAFGKIIADSKYMGDETFNDVLLVRAGGKVQAALFMKILNHFKKDYFVLHDIDSKKIIKTVTKKDSVTGKKIKEKQICVNAAWTNNSKFKDNMSDYSKVYGSIIDFETAYFDEAINSGKPLNALEQMKNSDNYNNVRNLLKAIITDDQALLPSRAILWTEIEEIDDAFESYKVENPEVEPKL